VNVLAYLGIFEIKNIIIHHGVDNIFLLKHNLIVGPSKSKSHIPAIHGTPSYVVRFLISLELKKQKSKGKSDYSNRIGNQCESVNLTLISVIQQKSLHRLHQENRHSLHQSEYGEWVVLALEFESKHIEGVRVDHTVLEAPGQAR
jgi:hypothetical protein